MPEIDDERAEIIILERGDYISFANCGLPYFIGGEITDKRLLTLQTPESFKARFNVEVRVNNYTTPITITILYFNGSHSHIFCPYLFLPGINL